MPKKKVSRHRPAVAEPGSERPGSRPGATPADSLGLRRPLGGGAKFRSVNGVNRLTGVKFHKIH